MPDFHERGGRSRPEDLQRQGPRRRLRRSTTKAFPRRRSSWSTPDASTTTSSAASRCATFPQSNGHGRAGITGPPRPTIGVLKITAQNGLTDRRAQSEASGSSKGSRPQERLLRLETLGGGRTPRLLYRVSPDGKRELVRGARSTTSTSAPCAPALKPRARISGLRTTSAMPPQTVLAPALLLRRRHRQPRQRENDKLPFYPAAGLKRKTDGKGS